MQPERRCVEAEATRRARGLDILILASVAGLPVGVGGPLLLRLLSGRWDGWTLVRDIALASTLTVGLLVLVVARIYSKAVKTGNASAAHQVRRIEMAGTPEAATRRAMAALRCIPRCKSPRVASDGRTVIARRGLSGLSWGEIITVRVEPIAAMSCRLHIDSRPRLSLTLNDFGLNAKHVNTVAAELLGSDRETLLLPTWPRR